MDMEKEKFLELASLHALDALDGEELGQFEKALAQADESLKREYAELRWTAFHLPAAAEPLQPSSSIKSALMAKLRTAAKPDNQTSTFHKPQRTPGWRPLRLAFGVTFVILLFCAADLFFYVSSLRTTVQLQQKRITALTTELEQKQKFLDVLQAKNIYVAIMRGLNVSPSAYGKVIWDPERRTAVLQISNLPPAPQDRDYQLWVIKDKTPVSAGIFSIQDSEKPSFFEIRNLAEVNTRHISAFAVTVEPKGGLTKPSGEMVLMGVPVIQ